MLKQKSTVEFEKWDQEMEDNKSDKTKLYEQLKSCLENGDNVQILWRLSRVCVFLSKQTSDKGLAQTKAREALGYADKACLMDPKNFNCHKWYCASAGRISAFVGSKEKIRYGHEFKEHADIALKLDSNDWYMLFIYGRWCYEVASLSWLERKLASTLFGSPPKATFDEALQYLKRSDKLKPNFKETYLWIGKTLLSMKKNSEAKVWIQNGLKINNTSVADENAHKELENLINKC